MASTSKSTVQKPGPTAEKKKPAAKVATPAKGSSAKSAPTKAAPKGLAAANPATEFKVFAPEATEVFLAGDFCDWREEDCRMRRFKDGSWKKSLKLKPGRYEYRFVVDGHWWTDPENPVRQQNPFGQDNSVLEVS